MTRLFFCAAAAYGAGGVLMGAFGAHALSGRLSLAQLQTWDTAVLYQLVHALGLLGVASLSRSLPKPTNLPTSLAVAGWVWVLGVLLFSGSLYALALGGPSLLGPITPVGGVLFVIGWLALAVWAWD